jgi:hypothetical protein
VSFKIIPFLTLALLQPQFAKAYGVPLAVEGYRLDIKELSWVQKQGDLILDHVTKTDFEVYGPEGLGVWLAKNHVHELLSLNNQHHPLDYPTPEQVGQKLISLAANYPHLAKLMSIGKSTQGRDLWVLLLTKNPELKNSGKPEFKYIANMHGDEIVGREMLILFAEDLLRNYGHEAEITGLMDSTELYIMPSMNPDGAQAQTRANAEGIDLNRDFPEATSSDPNSATGRALETQAVMAWQAEHHFLLSANFHGGAQVVNYPWDAKPEAFPLDSVVQKLAHEYANNSVYIAQSSEFAGGITNGFTWYQVLGGMQDWSFNYYKDLQLTIELSNEKWPDQATVSNYYLKNRSALLKLAERVHEIHQSTY